MLVIRVKLPNNLNEVVVMKICEIFESIQGEGPLSGFPALFIRVYGCPLKCKGCDTVYSHTNGKYKELSVSELVSIIESSNQEHVIFTGGEPLLYSKEILKIVDKLWPDKYFSMETSGVIMNEDIPLNIDQITVSPKKNYKRVMDVIFWWSSFSNVDFKFVVGDLDWCWSLSEIDEIVRKYHIDRRNVWLMPQGTTHNELNNFAKQVWEFCVKKGFRYSDRLHIRVWGNTPGR